MTGAAAEPFLTMLWYYVVHNAIEGPVTTDEFRRRVDDGVVGPDTLVWHEGLSSWVPFGTYTAPQGGTWVPEQWERQELRTPVGPILDEAWTEFVREPGPLIGRVLLLGLVQLAAWLAGMVLGVVIPFAGVVVGVLVAGPLYAGTQWMILEWHRGRPLQLANAFRVFGPRYGTLVMGQSVQAALLFGVAVPMVLGLAAMGVAAWMILQDPEAWSLGLQLGLLLGGAGVGLAGMLGYFYLLVAWLYAPMLILDKGMEFWAAMQLSRRVAYRHPWGFSWFLLVASVVALSGLVLFGVGIVVTLPLGYQMLMIAYQRQYGGLRVPAARQWPSSPSK
jgi:hypothetical protein